MSTKAISSTKETIKTSTKNTVIVYISMTLFLIAFNFIYSLFGHGVTSPFMTYAFGFSLGLGVVGFIVIGWMHVKNRIAFNLYNAGIATLIVGSLLRGILDIAGADTSYPVYYFIVGSLFVAIGGFLYLYQKIRIHQN